MFGDFVSFEHQKKSETETLGEGVVKETWKIHSFEVVA
jgi:hypothetical protein